jgi:gluconate 2-dehydrogenase gamma chain
MASGVSRREMLKRAAAVGALSAVPGVPLAQAPAGAPPPYLNLTPGAARTLEAMVARLIPSDENGPGALEAGAARYIDRALGGFLAGVREAYEAGLAALDAHARAGAGKPFAELDAERQDSVLRDLEQGAATGFASSSTAFFDLVLAHTLEGTFGDPHYGGNRDFVGWDMIGYPGLRLAVTAEQQRMSAAPTPTRISAYDLGMFEPHEPASGDHDDR